jgi:glycosyltransferase involved in cell wall biosynthesis
MITIVMSCYNPPNSNNARAKYSRETLECLIKYLPKFDYKLHVADDGSIENTFIVDLCNRATAVWKNESTYTITKRQGIGASLNAALREGVKDTALWMYITDDWCLTDTLPLAQAIALLTDFGYDMVKLGPIHPNLLSQTRFDLSIGWWLDLFNTTGFVFATRPFLATKEFWYKVGPFDEKLNAYETERLYSERVHRDPRLKMAQTGDITLLGPWRHIGEYEVGTINV